MMGVTALLGATGLLLVMSLLLIGLLKKEKGRKRPSVAAMGILVLQAVLLLLFFTGVLDSVPSIVFDVLWWGCIIGGLVFGILEFRRNLWVSLLLLGLTVIFSMFMVLMLLIGSM